MPFEGAGKIGSAAMAAQQGAGLSSMAQNSGAFQKDKAEAETAPQFGDVLKKMQNQYGAKPEKQREIKKTLGKDDFLHIMITQMQHQDPTNPFKAEQMAAQMAQFASLEQLQNMNLGMNKMAQANQPMEHMAMANLIGKSVTIDRDRFPHAEGATESLPFMLPQDAKSVKVSLIHESGETALEKDLGPLKKGENAFNWDGLKGNSLPGKGGQYMLRVDALDEKGVPIRINSESKSRVVGVSFEGKDAVLLVGDNRQQSKILLKNVVKIESDPSVPSLPGSAPMGAAGQADSAEEPAKPSSNFFTFQKGVGSANLDPGRASPEIQQALAQYEAGQNAGAQPQGGAGAKAPGAAVSAAQAGAQGGVQEKGFPNGLQD